MPHRNFLDLPYPRAHGDMSGPTTIAFETALVLANIFPIVVVYHFRRPRQRLAADELIAALSITDMLSVLVPAPLGWLAYFKREWYGGQYTCEFYHVTLTWFQLTSMCLVTFMCFDRWMSLRDAMSYKMPSCGANWRMRVSIFLVYLFTLVVSCLPLAGLAPKAMSPSGKLCQSWLLADPEFAVEHVFHFVFLTIGFSNLLTAILVNITVIASLWKFQRRFGNKASERMSSAALQIDRRSVVESTVMILIVTLVFYLAWMPVLLMVTLRQVGLAVPRQTVLYSLLSTTLTGLLNPVIYGVFSRTYRRGYSRLMLQASKCVFGCPLSQEDVINDISSQARRMRSATSTSNSMAGLLQSTSRQEEPPDDVTTRQPASRLGGPTDNMCFTVSHDSDPSLVGKTPSSHNYQQQPDANLLSPSRDSRTVSRDVDETMEAGSREDELHERTYIDEVLEESGGITRRDLYGSNLSLISEESDAYGDQSSVDSFEVITSSAQRGYRYPSVIQESMI